MRRVPDLQVEIRAECRLYASEDPGKVISAVKNVITNCSPERKDGRVIAVSRSTEALTTIYEQVRSRAVMGVLKKVLLNNMFSDTTWFYLNKQAAYAGTLSICDEESESPLGPIKVTIRSRSIEAVINWLVPL